MTGRPLWYRLTVIIIIITILFPESLAGVFHIPLGMHNTMFWCPISIGTPPQTFRVQIDTGSTPLWIFGKSIKNKIRDSPTSSMKRAFYDGQSTSKKQYPAKWWQFKKKSVSMNYLDGDSFKGKMIIDAITSNGAPLINDASLAVMNRVKLKTAAPLMDGIMGLSPFVHEELKIKSKPFFLQLLEAGTLDEGLISIYISCKKRGGELSFGGVNKLRFKGEINYFPVWHSITGKYYEWGLTLDSAKLEGGGGGSKNVKLLGRGLAVSIDTGASHIFVPVPVFSYIFRSTGARWTRMGTLKPPVAECSNRKKLRDLVFTFGGIEYRLTGEEYVRMVLPGLCVLEVMPSESTYTWSIGQPFLYKYYSVFDFDKKRIGFAEADHEHEHDEGDVVAFLTTPPACSVNSNMTNCPKDEMIYNRINETAIMGGAQGGK